MSKNVLLIIDPQVDFHGDTLTPETGRGSLAVGGADKDALVTANFIKKPFFLETLVTVYV
jgi:hypothetical protein